MTNVTARESRQLWRSGGRRRLLAPDRRRQAPGGRAGAMSRILTGGLLLLASSTVFAGDPFADVRPVVPEPSAVRATPGWRDNLLFRREIYLSATAGVDDFQDTRDLFSRLAAGLEVMKSFATATKTVASVNYRGRVVFRDRRLDTASDPMGMDAGGWEYKTLNAYADFYSLFGAPGRFNLRAGRFYLPFGLNTQTDTHGTLLQLSNDRVFGVGHDWQVTAYGNATEHLDYMVGYLLGAGPDQRLDGQSGMAVGRIGLGNALLFEHGIEGGLSGAYGQRLDPHAGMAHPVSTWRAGADLRKRFDSGMGPFTLTGEGAVGEDESAPIWSGLAQLNWLHPSRRWGAATQYFYHEREHDAMSHADEIDQRAIFVLTHYFRNDIGNAALHWIALGIERPIQTTEGREDTLLTMQYYRYW